MFSTIVGPTFVLLSLKSSRLHPFPRFCRKLTVTDLSWDLVACEPSLGSNLSYFATPFSAQGSLGHLYYQVFNFNLNFDIH